MPGNTKARYQYLGTAVNGRRGFATLVREGDHETYEIPLDWVPDNLQNGVSVEVVTEGQSGTITIKPVQDDGPKISAAITGGD